MSPRPPPGDERELVADILSGDESAFTALVERLHPALVALARMYVRVPEVAEEVVQDSWIAVLKGLERFEHRSALKTWISSIVINQAKRRGERESRTMPFSSLGEPESAVDADAFTKRGTWLDRVEAWRTDPQEQLFDSDTRAFLTEEIEKLPEAQRAVIVLRHVNGWDSKEVCEALDISEGNQRVLLHRGRSRLRKALDRRFRDA